VVTNFANRRIHLTMVHIITFVPIARIIWSKRCATHRREIPLAFITAYGISWPLASNGAGLFA